MNPIATETLELLKRHLRIDDYSDAAEDAYAAHLYDAALTLLYAVVNRTEEEMLEKYGSGASLPEDFQHAAMMVAGHLHNQREGESTTFMNTDPFVLAVVKRYEKLSNRESASL